MTQLILYASEDGQSRVQLRAHRGTVWLSQRQMAELFDVSSDNIGLHLKNIYADGELQRGATAEESSVVQTEGGREVRRTITPLFLGYEQRRTSREAQAADAQDEAELKALENRIKDRKGEGA